MIIQVQNLVKRYGDVVAVDHLSFEVERGEIFGLLGPNGAGKTTTIRVIMDILDPDAGRVAVLGQPPGQAKRQVGYLPEERGLYRNLKVLDVLVYLAELKGVGRRAARERAVGLLERIQLEGWAGRKVRDLSRGMQQRLQFVASLVHDPPVLFLDEPFQGLDPVNADMLKGVVRAQKERGAAVIMSTHDMGDAQTLCDRILLIDKGHRLLYGTVDRVRDAFSDGAVQVSGANLPTTAEGLASVTDVHEVDGALRYLIREDATPQDLFRELAASGAEVERFAVQAPSLDEIFIRTVAGDHRAEAVR
jgi:ABC-2 type transport system ATP-binding protein